MREADSIFGVGGKMLFGVLMIVLLTATPVFSQIDYTSKESHKKQRKKFLKQANAADAEYKDTHLNVDTYNFKVGEAGRKKTKRKDGRAKYQFNDAGEPVKKKRFLSRNKNKRKSH